MVSGDDLMGAAGVVDLDPSARPLAGYQRWVMEPPPSARLLQAWSRRMHPDSSDSDDNGSDLIRGVRCYHI